MSRVLRAFSSTTTIIGIRIRMSANKLNEYQNEKTRKIFRIQR